ncbi:MAG: hypothetical protein EP346_12520 [Bacteroidetes bacterium]|nr:MAG: hypothetical protein EP346_12520 [Bacteroidota bacterium]
MVGHLAYSRRTHLGVLLETTSVYINRINMTPLGKPAWAYTTLYRYVRWMYIKLYCRTYSVHGLENVPHKGSVLFVTTHQNNLPDALSLGFASDRRPAFVARADLFKNPKVAVLLRFLKILPMHRADHGRKAITDELPETMHILGDYLAAGQSCTIMAEGSSAPLRSLRPLKKGWARLVLDAQSIGIQPTVIPVAMEYSDWQDWGPDVRVVFGKPLNLEVDGDTMAVRLKHMNRIAFDAISSLIASDEEIQSWSNAISRKRKWKDLMWKIAGTPFYIGFSVINAPVFWLTKHRVAKHHRVDFKSTLQVGFIGLGTPLWLMLLHLIATFFTTPVNIAFSALITPIIAYIAARTHIAWKKS